MGTANYELAPGQMVGEYRIEKKIGEGGFGKVYAAVHPVIGKAAAVKILNPDLAKNEEMVSRFVSEARSVNQIRHRNIIDIFSFGTLPGPLHYFVMEFLEGMTLDAYLRKQGPLSPELAFSILWPIGRALQAAHKHGITHRDLKPENVFLTFSEDGEIFPKLLDFGIAKLLHESEMAHRTRTGAMLGTPIYMSPEQCRGVGIDHRSDIYSFGIMVHEVLTGSRPFGGATLMDLLMKQVTEPAPPMSSSRPGIAKSLDSAVLHMLEKQPDKRPESMTAALDELGAAARAVGIAVPGGAHAAAQAPPAGRAPSPSTPNPDPHMETNAWLQQSGGQSGVRSVGSSSGAVAAITGPSNSSGHLGQSPALQSGNLGQAPPQNSGNFGQAQSQQSGNSGQAQSQQSGNLGQAPPHRSGHLGQSPQQQSAHWGQAPPHQSGNLGAPSGYPITGPAGMTPPPGQYGNSAPYGGPPAGPGWNGPYSPGQGAYPPGGPTLQSAGSAPQKSSFGLVAAILAGAFFLFVIGGVGMCSFLASVGDGVTIGTEGLATTDTISRSSADDLTMVFTPAGQQIATASTDIHAERRFTVKVLATSEQQVTRAEVAYTDVSTTTTGADKKVSTETSPVANHTYLVEQNGASLNVTALSGAALTDVERTEVMNDAKPFFQPKPAIFNRPLHVGDALTPPSDAVLMMLGLESTTPGSHVRADNATFKLTAVSESPETATFDVAFLYTYEEGELKLSVPIQGTITYDRETGVPVSGSLHGPVDGSFLNNGSRFRVTGNFTAETH